jgi:large subunit ribosomal protein L35
MPKLKTKRGAYKRFWVSKRGKIRHKKAFKSHLLTKKTTKRKRNLRRANIIQKAEKKMIKSLIPWI